MAQSLLLYGESGTFKTTQIGLFADYEFERTGLPTRLITCDSGFGPVASQVERGTIIPLRLEACPHPVPVLNKLSKGLWPSRVINIADGLWYMDPGAQFESYTGSKIRTGAVAVEGLTRICELVRKSWCDEHREMGEPLQGKYEQDGEQFAFQSRGTLFGTQQLINNLVINFRGLSVDRVLFTAHESKGKDVTGKTMFGPATTGLALTDKVSGWFEITLHHESYQYAIKKGMKTLIRPGVKAYFTRHADKEVKGMYWPAKLGVSAQIAARMFELHDEGWIALAMDGEEYVSGLHSFLYAIDNGGSYETQAVADIATEQGEYVEPAVQTESLSDEQISEVANQGVGVLENVPVVAVVSMAVQEENTKGPQVVTAGKGRGRR
jgi:hypothetical protein